MIIGLYCLGWFTCFMCLFELESAFRERVSRRRALELGALSLAWPLIGFVYLLVFQRQRRKSKSFDVEED